MNRKPHLLIRLRRRLASESGMTLVLTLGAMTVVGMLGTSTLLYTSQNAGSASRSSADTIAHQLAEAGINNAMSVLTNPANDPTNANLLPVQVGTYDGGTVTWSGSYDSGTSTWTLTSASLVRNPTGPGSAPVRKIITAKAPVSSGQTPIGLLQNPAWNYDTATRTGNACDMTLTTSVTVSAPLYTMGNLCLSNLSLVSGGPLEVRGGLTVGSGNVGTLGTPIDRADIFGGCGGHVCTSADHVYATSSTQTPDNVTPPVAAWDYWYANAAPGPKHPCEQASGPYPVFDNNSVRDKSLTTVYSLTPPTSYTCRVGPVGNPTSELSWDATTKTLTISGTVFIDGQAKIDNGQIDTYKGQGVLYVSGAFAVTGGSKMCAAVSGLDCDFTPGAWDPNKNLFAVASNGNGGIGVLSGNSIQLGCLDRIQAALYGTNAVQFTAGGAAAKHEGPIVASTILFSASMELKPFGTLKNVPNGLPGQSPTTSQVGAPRDFTE